MTRPARACPICPGCSSKKFERLGPGDSDAGGGQTVIRCIRCGRILRI